MNTLLWGDERTPTQLDILRMKRGEWYVPGYDADDMHIPSPPLSRAAEPGNPAPTPPHREGMLIAALAVVVPLAVLAGLALALAYLFFYPPNWR